MREAAVAQAGAYARSCLRPHRSQLSCLRATLDHQGCTLYAWEGVNLNR